MAPQCRVVERDLRVEADEPFDRRAAGVGLAHDRQRVDLDEVRVVRPHRGDEALGDRDRRLEVAAEAHREGELAGLVVEEAEERIRVAPDDRLGMVRRHLLDLDAALRRSHEQDSPRSARSSTAER